MTVDDGWTKKTETQSNDNSYNTPANVVFNTGGLSLLAKRQQLGGRPYTSADILGHHISVPNYFRAEVTGTAPIEGGMWPCLLWFRPLNGGSDGEIDVMETWPAFWAGTPTAVSTLHNAYNAPSGYKQENATLRYSKLPNPNPAASHTYVVEKIAGRMSFWIDGVLVYSWAKGSLNARMATWWDQVFEVRGRTWYPRITMQVGGPNAKEPAAAWRQSKLTVTDLRIYVPNV